MGWPCDDGELAACFTAHSRDLFGYACVLCDADRALAGDLVQAAFEAAATAWGTLRGLPADQHRHWLQERLAAQAQSRTGHLAGGAFVSPTHRRLTELKMARYRSDYDTAAGLDRFAGWLSARADGARSAPGGGPPGLRLAHLHAVPDGAAWRHRPWRHRPWRHRPWRHRPWRAGRYQQNQGSCPVRELR